MTIEICKVVNYEAVSKMLNLLYSQNPYSISLFFHPNSASNPPKIAQFYLNSASNPPPITPFSHQFTLKNHPPSPNSAQRVGWLILNQTPYPQ